MKPRTTGSRSTFRALLSVQGPGDEQSGLQLRGRVFRPNTDSRSRPLLWLLCDALLLTLLGGGQVLLVVTGFSLSVSWLLIPLTVLLAGLTALLFHSRAARLHPLPFLIVLPVVYFAVLILLQRPFLAGARVLLYQLVRTVNEAYDSSVQIDAAAGRAGITIFLAMCLLPILLWLGSALLRRGSFPMALGLLLPLTAAVLLCGAQNTAAALFVLLFGAVFALAYIGPKRQKRMWGGDDAGLYRENEQRFHRVQKRNALLLLAAALVLSVPGYLLVRPLLSFSLTGAESTALQVQSEFLSRVLQILPDISAGQWNLQIETVSGGVQDGSLAGDAEGYSLTGVEDLVVTVSEKPEETIFLRGYIGTDYDGENWTVPSVTTFDAAALNWKTDGDAHLYIRNLPFLRTAYAVSLLPESDTEPALMTVTRVNANDDYTYVPYGAYLNDYYTLDSGDGAVDGRSAAEDSYYFYFSADTEAILQAWNELDDTASVLDRTEESYHAFCTLRCLTVAEGLEELQAEVSAVMSENEWNSTENITEISAWIRRYLAENYSYDINASAPAGTDPLLYFLNESRTGYSVQFASAAVELFRMFGVPARYVVGYEAFPSQFSADQGGGYSAVLQEDNAQAWAEIYIPGIGWSPVDATPGMIGTLEEVGYGGEVIAADDEDAVPADGTQQPAGQQEEKEESTGISEKPLTVGQIIAAIAAVLLLAAAVGALAAGGHRYCIRYGYDPFRRRTPLQRMLGIFAAFFRCMQKRGLPPEADSEDPRFLPFCEQQLAGPDYTAGELTALFTRLRAACYGTAEPEEADITALRGMLQGLRRKIPAKR